MGKFTHFVSVSSDDV